MRPAVLRGVARAAIALFALAVLLTFLVTLLFTFTLLAYYNPPPLGILVFPAVTALLGLLTFWSWRLYRRLSSQIESRPSNIIPGLERPTLSL